MRRLGGFIILPIILLTLAGCGPKPENVVREYLQCCCSGDVGKAKSLCTGNARIAIGNIHEELLVDRVMAAGADEGSGEGHTSWPEIESKLEISLEGMDEFNAMVVVKTHDEEVTFKLMKIDNKWMISGISNPKFGLDMVKGR